MGKYSMTLQKIDEYENNFTPQANDLNKVVTLIEVMKKTWIPEMDIALVFSFSTRQAHYYGDCLRFLELVDTFEYGSKITMMGLKKDAYKFFENGAIRSRLKEWIIQHGFLIEYEKRLNNIKNKGRVLSEDDEQNTFKRRQDSLNAWRRWINE